MHDIIIFGKTAEYITKTIKLLKTKLDLKLLGKTKKLLGIELENEKGKVVHLPERIH